MSNEDEYVLREECERRIDSAFKEAERYRELSLIEAVRADRAEAKLAALVGAGGPSSGAMESRHDSAARVASTAVTARDHRRTLATVLTALGVVALLAELPTLLQSHGASLLLTLPVAGLLLYGAWRVLHKSDA